MVAEELRKDYWKMIRRTRLSGRISPALVCRVEGMWKGFDADVVVEALKIHLDRYPGERECYTLGIMRNLQRGRNNGRGHGNAES